MADGWSIVAQQQTTDLTPDGRFQEVMRITFQTTEGVTGTLTVPISEYNPQHVQELISARAAAIKAVHNL